MAVNVVINSVQYNAVPSVSIPKVGGGTAVFTDTSDATIENGSQMLNGVTAYDANGAKVTGTVASKSAQTYTPSTTNQTIASGQFLSGVQTILGDADLVSSNIKKGANIFGVAGSNTVVDTAIASGGATASTIITGSKAYVNGELVTGTASMPTISQDSTTKILSIS